MRILVFGTSGQVGWALQRSLAPVGEVVALGRDGAPGLPGDFAQPQALAASVRAVQPQVVVIAAAHTAVDRAESEPALAHTINAEAPAVLAQATAEVGALLVHYSTDYVFDGSGQRPWREDDAPGPLGVYGRTKLAGEEAVRRLCPRHLVLRTSWVHGTRGGNFARTMLRLARERDRLSVVDDQVGAPTGADLLADLTAHMVRATRAQPALCGLYHAAAAGETSWHGYACRVLARARQAGATLRAGPEAVDAVPSSAWPTPARRPLNSRLDTSRLRQAFGLALPDWGAGVDRLVDELEGGNR